ncbi:unnamed protein product [Effrenium voratum]|nr:unnamed protein product [Effrenium voratum]
MTSKVSIEASSHLNHNFSECSTLARDGTLAEGSLSHFGSLEDEGGGASLFSEQKPREMVLLQLKLMAPTSGHLSDGPRARRADRHYELLVEPSREAVPGIEPGGHMPWLATLRPNRRAARLPQRRLAPPMQLVSLLPTQPAPRPRPFRRRRAPALPAVQKSQEALDDTGLGTTIAILADDDPPRNEHSSRPSIELGLPLLLSETCDEDTQSTIHHKDPVQSATWPLANWNLETSVSLSSSGISGNKSMLPSSRGISKEHSLRPSYSCRRLSERRRSWLKANEATRKKSPGYLNQRSQLREMVATMTKTMTQTFDRSVWDACDVAHPDQEQERLHAARAKVVEAQLEQFKGLKPAIKGRRASRDEKRDSARRSFGIMSRTGALPPTEMTDEKLLAHLARQTGWSVLDVEEVWEVFFAFAPTGRIAVQAPEFIQLVQELYEGVSDDEIMLLQQHINAVRTRNQTRARFMRRALTGLDNNAPERADVRFSEFYMALVKWLDLQQSRMEARTEVKDRMKSRCSLSRFAAGSLLQLQMPKSSISNISMSAGNMNLEDFRKLKKEVEASSPRSQRDGGIGNAMLVRKKQREGKASRKRASKDLEETESEDVTDDDDDDDDDSCEDLPAFSLGWALMCGRHFLHSCGCNASCCQCKAFS